MAYTTAANVRELGLQKREFVTGVTGVDIVLSDYHTEALIAFKKNGSTFAATFIPPNTMRMGTEAIASDYFEITRAVYMSDTEISTTITEAEAIIDGQLAKAYALPFAASHPILVTLSRQLTRAMCLKKLARSAEFNVHPAELESANTDITEVTDILERIIRNRMEIVDASNAVVARNTGYMDVGIYVGMDDSTEEV